MKLKEGNIQRQNNTSSILRLIIHLLHQLRPINIFQFIINSSSFSQTVENMFYLILLLEYVPAKNTHGLNSMPIITYIDSLHDKEMEMKDKNCIIDITQGSYEVIPPSRSQHSPEKDAADVRLGVD